MRLTLIGLLSCAAVGALSFAEAANPVKPPPPPSTIPDIRQSKVAVLCVGCDEPFDTQTHKKILEGLVDSPYIAELRKALYLQDSLHQFESKVHFDNCDFDEAIDYINALLNEVDGHVKMAREAKAKPTKAPLEAAVRRAFFALGQALHGVQDFYAHTNYVELQVPQVKRITDIEIVAPWRKGGRERIALLRNKGLVSGFVFWGFPQKCPAGSLSHSELAKDSADTKSGARKVPTWQNNNLYTIAEFLAREASLSLVTDAFTRWPLLKEMNGRNVAFDVLVDRRGI